MSLLLLFGASPPAGNNGSLNETLGALTLNGAGTVVVSGNLSETLGPLTLSGSGAITISGSLAETLGALTLAGTGTVTGAATGSLDETLGALTLVGTGINGNPTIADLVVNDEPAEILGFGPHRYEVESRVRFTAAFTDALSGSPVSPSDVVFFLRLPDGSETSVDLSGGVETDGPGLYHYDVVVDEPGTWIYKWQGTGTVEITSPDTNLIVNRTVFNL
jgi:hypothetical protein